MHAQSNITTSISPLTAIIFLTTTSQPIEIQVPVEVPVISPIIKVIGFNISLPNRTIVQHRLF